MQSQQLKIIVLMPVLQGIFFEAGNA